MQLPLMVFVLVLLLQALNTNCLPYVNSSLDGRNPEEIKTDIQTLRQHFKNIFSVPRQTDEEKQVTRYQVLAAFQKYGLETAQHPFNVKNLNRQGINVIGILPGKNRLAGKPDSILMVSSHFDTVKNVAGVEDNGSGSVAVLELARLVSQAKVQLDHTIMFVMFDFEELGAVGSEFFVRDWLIPRELRNTDTQFLGLYHIDMVLNYDVTPGAQRIPKDLEQTCPEEMQKIKDNRYLGDFLAAITRRGVDNELHRKLFAEWPKTEGSKKYKLRKFDVPKITDITWRSDHNQFWCPRVKPEYFSKPLRAMYVMDFDDLRGEDGKCNHKKCDDEHFLTDDNLGLLKTLVDAMYRVLVFSPPAPLTEDEAGKVIACPKDM